MRTLRTLCAVFALVALGLASPAQNWPDEQQHRASRAANQRDCSSRCRSARHHRHRDRDRGRDDDAVTYNLDPQREKLSVTEEVRPMLVHDGSGSVARQEQVRIITVVAR